MSNTVWYPDSAQITTCALQLYKNYLYKKHRLQFSSYKQLHDWSIAHRHDFWESIWDFFDIKSQKRAKSVLNNGHDMLSTQWFNGARFNFAENLLRYNDERIALIACNEQGETRTISYCDLNKQVAKVAYYLLNQGVVAGDRVVAVLPNAIESVVAMLATTSIGAVWSACSPDFGTEALRDRFLQVEPKVLFAVDSYSFKGKYYSLNNKLKDLIHSLNSLETIIIKTQNIQGKKNVQFNYTCYDELLLGKERALSFVALPFEHPVYILFSSGTTGKPKCFVHGAGGVLLQHLKELALHSNLKTGDKLLFYTTCGWMMWNWQVSALALGVTLCLYDGSPFYPTTDNLLTTVEKLEITHFGTGASYFNALFKTNVGDCKQSFNSLKTILSTGSPLLPEMYECIYRRIKQNIWISSISGGSDIVSCFMLGNPQLPVHAGQIQVLGLGMDVQFYTKQGNRCCINQSGELVCVQSFPSQPIYFYSDLNKNKYRSAYFDHFEGIWTHGDYGMFTEQGGIIIQGRSDATLNQGGVRIGTAEIYQQIAKFNEIHESIAVTQTWRGDERMVLFVVLQPNLMLTQIMKDEINRLLLHNASPRHLPKKIIAVPDLPKTMNGKLCELAVKQVINGGKVDNTLSLSNPNSLIHFRNIEELMS